MAFASTLAVPLAYCAKAEVRLSFSDGTRVSPGDAILNLHLWNEHIPAMGPGGPTLAWARKLSRSIESSLYELVQYLEGHPELNDVVALRADMRLGAVHQISQLGRISARYGFEEAACEAKASSDLQSSVLQRLGENILILLLVLATNPAAVRPPVFRRNHKVVYLSRTPLARRRDELRCCIGK